MSSSLIVAIDYMDEKAIHHFCDNVSPKACRIKMGIDVLTRLGFSLVKIVQQKGFDVFLDLKYYDVPNLVASSINTIAEMGVWMTSLHASGGSIMMEKAKQALEKFGKDAPLLVAVSVLSSMTQEELLKQGIHDTLVDQATRLNMLAKNCGLDGILCAPQDLQRFRTRIVADSNFKLLTTGIRPLTVDADDQPRVTTPKRALASGADFIIIGRPITQAADPIKALNNVLAMME